MKITHLLKISTSHSSSLPFRLGFFGEIVRRKEEGVFRIRNINALFFGLSRFGLITTQLPLFVVRCCPERGRCKFPRWTKQSNWDVRRGLRLFIWLWNYPFLFSSFSLFRALSLDLSVFSKLLSKFESFFVFLFPFESLANHGRIAREISIYRMLHWEWQFGCM